jgi:hypothetical protein
MAYEDDDLIITEPKVTMKTMRKVADNLVLNQVTAPIIRPA